MILRWAALLVAVCSLASCGVWEWLSSSPVSPEELAQSKDVLKLLVEHGILPKVKADGFLRSLQVLADGPTPLEWAWSAVKELLRAALAYYGLVLWRGTPSHRKGNSPQAS